MRHFVRTALICLAAATLSLVAGDLKITYINTMSVNISDQTQKSSEEVYYSSRYQLTSDSFNRKDTLIDFDELVSYEIDHKRKVIRKVTLDDMNKFAEMVSDNVEKSGIDSEINKVLKIEENTNVSVNKTGAEKIVKRKCDKWKVSLGKLVCDVSTDPTLKPPVDTKKAGNLDVDVSMLIMLGKSFVSFMEAINNIEGIPLRTDLIIPMGSMDMKFSSVAISIKEGSIPASRFELPKDYKIEDHGKKLIRDYRDMLKSNQQ
jgi:hypothetical protein